MDLPSTPVPAKGGSSRLRAAVHRIDEENARDPNVVNVDGVPVPRELAYAEWLTGWVLRLAPEASEALILAARCQHICRWMIPRASYEMTRAGYLQWREELKKFHSRRSSEVLREVGYSEEMIARVGDLNLKKNLSEDPECQTLEDALCLVTLEHQLSALMEKNEPEKMVTILQKTWKKMSPAGRQHALTISFSPAQAELIGSAITPLSDHR